MAYVFSKYAQGGALHWKEMTSRSILHFNAHQQARYDTVLRELRDIRGKTVVDLGAGDGALTSLIVRGGADVIAVDNEEKGLDLARVIFEREGLSARFLLGSVEEVPLPDASADAVVSCDVIEHLDHFQKHVAEAARILKPGGICIITTPYRICETPAPFHIHEFYPSELRQLATPHFSHVRIVETHHMFWNALYNYKFRFARRQPLGKWFVNIMTLWFGCNPFLQDDAQRKKRDYYTQLTLVATR